MIFSVSIGVFVNHSPGFCFHSILCSPISCFPHVPFAASPPPPNPWFTSCVVQVDVSCDSGSDNEKFLRLMQTEGRAWLRSRAETLLKELKAGHGVQEKKAGVTENVSVKKTPEKKKDAGENTDFATKIEWRVPPKVSFHDLHPDKLMNYPRSHYERLSLCVISDCTHNATQWGDR